MRNWEMNQQNIAIWHIKKRGKFMITELRCTRRCRKPAINSNKGNITLEKFEYTALFLMFDLSSTLIMLHENEAFQKRLFKQAEF